MLCGIYPIISSVLEQKKILSFGFILPFFDRKTNFGFLINYLYQSLQVVLTGLMYGAFCRIYWQLFGNAIVKIELLKEAANELKENIMNYVFDAEDADSLSAYHQQISLKLKEIVDLQLEYLRFQFPYTHLCECFNFNCCF